jgi:hypothetical protein
LFRNKDPIIGIEQIDTQYKSISEIIFKPENSQLDNILTSAEACKKYFEDKIEGYKNDATYGEFVTTNEQHLKDNANFIVRYMEANNVFGETSVLSKKSNIEKLHALTKLFKILQTGNREARRHDVVA